MKLNNVPLVENESVTDNSFIFEMMELNEEIDDAEMEAELKGD